MQLSGGVGFAAICARVPERRERWKKGLCGQAKKWTAHPAQPKLPVSSSRLAMLDADPALLHSLLYFRLLVIGRNVKTHRFPT